MGAGAGPLEQRIDARWLMAYSAGLGETDPRCYDTTAPGGVLAHPLFPVCYEWPLSQPLRSLPALQPYYPRLVHAQHSLLLHRAPRAGDRLQVSARIAAVTQRKPGAFVVFRFEARDAEGGPVSTTDFGALYRGVEVQGGDRQVEPITDPPGFAGSLPGIASVEVQANAAHVYTECARIWNPIHTDIAYARAAGLPDIILHGTATLALSISSALRELGLQPAAVRRVQCRFSGMVRMPSTLALHARRDADTVAFEARSDRGEAVITRGTLLLE